MALLFECMLSCARNLIDTAAIVREAILRPLADASRSARAQIERIVNRRFHAKQLLVVVCERGSGNADLDRAIRFPTNHVLLELAFRAKQSSEH